MWTGRRPLTAAGPLRLTILSRRLRVRRSREHRASGAPTRQHDVGQAHQPPRTRDREADVRLVLRVGVADDVEGEDRAQHGAFANAPSAAPAPWPTAPHTPRPAPRP